MTTLERTIINGKGISSNRSLASFSRGTGGTLQYVLRLDVCCNISVSGVFQPLDCQSFQTLDCQSDTEISYSQLLTLLQAAQELHKLGPKYVLIKGGHLITPPPSDPTNPSSPPSAPPTSAPVPSHPTAPAAPSPSAAAAASSSAPQSSPKDTSHTQDSAGQSSESAPATSSPDVSLSVDAFTSETHGAGSSAATRGDGDAASDLISAAGEGTTTSQHEGMQAKPISSGYVLCRVLSAEVCNHCYMHLPPPPLSFGLGVLVWMLDLAKLHAVSHGATYTVRFWFS